jgi:hypothetical protein
VGWIDRSEERNAARAKWLAEHPDASSKVLPFAKSPAARVRLLALLALIAAATYFFGLLGGAAVLVVAIPVIRRLEIDPTRDHRGADGP